MHSFPISNQRPSAATWLIITLAAGVYLAGGWCVNLWDRDEAWYAQSSRQMVQSGDWLIPRFLDQPRYAKPIFIYWCQATSMSLFGQNEMAARLPSAIAMTGTLILLALALSRFANPRTAHYTVLIFASSAMTLASAKMCLTDSVMLFFLTICQLALAALYIYPSSFIRHPLRHFLWPALALAILTKGPIPLVILLATSLFLALLDGPRQFLSNLKWLKQTRPLIGLLILLATSLFLALLDGPRQFLSNLKWLKQTRPLIGLLILLLICLPWPILAYQRDPAFLHNLFLEPVRHFSTNQDGHLAWPGYYILTIWLTFFPWSLFLPFTLLFAWRNRTDPAVRLALATFIANFLFAEVMITKLPHYLLPSFTSLAFLTARMLLAWFDPRPGLHSPPVIHSIAISWFASIAILYLFIFPNFQPLRLPARIATELHARNLVNPSQLIMTGYTEPSLAFYTDGLIRHKEDQYLTATPFKEWPTAIVLTQKLFDSLPADRQNQLVQIASLEGFNYNIPFGKTTVLICRKRLSD